MQTPAAYVDHGTISKLYFSVDDQPRMQSFSPFSIIPWTLAFWLIRAKRNYGV